MNLNGVGQGINGYLDYAAKKQQADQEANYKKQMMMLSQLKMQQEVQQMQAEKQRKANMVKGLMLRQQGLPPVAPEPGASSSPPQPYQSLSASPSSATGPSSPAMGQGGAGAQPDQMALLQQMQQSKTVPMGDKGTQVPVQKVQQMASMDPAQLATQAARGGMPLDQVGDMLKDLEPFYTAEQKAKAEAVHEQLAQAREDRQERMSNNSMRHQEVMEGLAGRRADQADQRMGMYMQNMQDLIKNRDAGTELRKNAAAGGAAGVEALTPGGMEVAKELTKAGRPLPGGWSQKGINRGNALLNAMAVDEAKSGTAGDGSIVQAQASYKADESGLVAITKDKAQIGAYAGMLDKTVDVASNLADKVMKVDNTYGNKSLNWIQSNLSDSPEVRDYLFQVNTVRVDAARVLNNPRLVGQLSDEAKRDMTELVNGEMPIKATKAVFNRIKADSALRVGELSKAHDDLVKSTKVGAGYNNPAAGSGDKKPLSDY